HPGPFWHRFKVDFQRNGLEYWEELVGRLGWLNISLPAWVPPGFAAALILLPFFGNKKPPWPFRWKRIVLGAAVVPGIIAIQLTLCATFNGVGSVWILGVQGRYFTVLAFLAAF